MATYTYGDFRRWYTAPPAVQIYIAPRTDGISGSGSATDPYDASTAAKYDAIVQGHHDRGTAIYYAPGLYWTNGWQWSLPQTAYPHVYHIGPGRDLATVRLQGSAAPIMGNVELAIFACSYDKAVDGFQLHNLTLDCNATTNTSFVSRLSEIRAVDIRGSNVLVKNCKIMGWGTSVVTVESFPVYIHHGVASFGGQTIRHAHIEDCLFTEPATGNQDGCTIAVCGGDGGIELIDFAVLNCTWIDVASDFLYSHAFACFFCQGNNVTGCEVGFYSEPGSLDQDSLQSIHIDSNTFTLVRFPINIHFHPKGVTGPWVITNNLFVMSNAYSPFVAGFSFSAHNPPTTQPAVPSVTFDSNEFGGYETLPTDTPYYRCVYSSGIAALVCGTMTIANNRVASNTPSGCEFYLNTNSIGTIESTPPNKYLDGTTCPLTLVIS
jgi:hypothetical protein